MAEHFSIVIPTYNEHDSISPLLEGIHQALPTAGYDIVFMDDDSRDGTPELIKSLAEKYPVRVVVRKGKKGLATAVADGFAETTAGVVVIMDADLQHPPAVIAPLVAAIDAGTDIAVASRYVPGGGNRGWSKMRQLISNGAIMLAHLFLPASRRVKDPMSGFFAFKRAAVAGLKLEPIGYKILLELLVLAPRAKVSEVPFIFNVREQGKSKLNWKLQVEYLKHIFSLMRRSGELVRMVKFALVGGSGVIVNEGTRLLLVTYTSLAYPYDRIAQPIGIELSIITNFLLNNYFTFRDRRAKGPAAFSRKLLKFNLMSLVGAAIQIAVYNGLRSIGWVDAPWASLANLIGIGLAMTWNFLSNSWWTWEK